MIRNAPLGPTTERLDLMWTLILLPLFIDPVTGAANPDAGPDDVAIECPDTLAGLPDLVQRRCREAIALQPASGGGTRPIIILPAAAAAAAGIALAGAKDDRPTSR